MSNVDAISALLKPCSVAVVGASSDPSKIAGRPVAYLLKHGFTGTIYPINSRVDAIGDLRCYPDVDSLPTTPDVGVVLLGVEQAHFAVRDLARRGTSAAIVLAGGYAETGAEGAARQQQLREAAGSMRILGPNTIGLVNLTDNICLSASGTLAMGEFSVGSIGVVSQSGGVLGALLSRAAARGIGLSKLIATGNEVDLGVEDFVRYLADDPQTRVIALYIESIRNPDKFRAAARYVAARGKPLVVFKIGRSEGGARAAASHTGALAGSDRMYDAFFEKLGVIRVSAFGDLLDVPLALSTGRVLRGKRIAILTSTGGAGTLLSDSLGVFGFDTPAPDDWTASALRALQEGIHASFDHNPIDVTLAGLKPDLLRRVIRVLMQSDCYDALTVVVGASGVGAPELMAGAIRDCLPLGDKPVIAFISPHAPQAESILTRYGVPAYSVVESCGAAFDGMRRHSQWTAHRDSGIGELVDVADLPTGSIDEHQAKQLFNRFGIPTVAEAVAATPEQATAAAAAFNKKIVLKVLCAEITHKSDVGGVAIDLEPDRLGFHMNTMAAEVQRKTGVAPTRFLVQEMLRDGTEMILGMHRDSLGTAILLGMGGVTAELLNDTSMRLLSDHGGLSREQVASMLTDIKTLPLLQGFRGRPKADIDALVTAVVSFSRMVAQMGERLIEAEINPLFVLREGEGVRAVDGVVVLGPPSVDCCIAP